MCVKRYIHHVYQRLRAADFSCQMGSSYSQFPLPLMAHRSKTTLYGKMEQVLVFGEFGFLDSKEWMEFLIGTVQLVESAQLPFDKTLVVAVSMASEPEDQLILQVEWGDVRKIHKWPVCPVPVVYDSKYNQLHYNQESLYDYGIYSKSRPLIYNFLLPSAETASETVFAFSKGSDIPEAEPVSPRPKLTPLSRR